MTCSSSRECAFSTAPVLGEPRAQVRARMRSLKSGRSKASARRRSELRLEAAGVRLEALHGVGQRLDRLPREEEAGRRLGAARRHHRLARAAVPEGDDRPPRRHGLERRDAEILERGEDERPAARVELGDVGVVPPAEQLDGGPGERPKAPLLRARCRRPRAGAAGGWPPRPRGRRACTAPGPRRPGSSRRATRRWRKRATSTGG